MTTRQEENQQYMKDIHAKIESITLRATEGIAELLELGNVQAAERFGILLATVIVGTAASRSTYEGVSDEVDENVREIVQGYIEPVYEEVLDMLQTIHYNCRKSLANEGFTDFFGL